MGDAPSGALGVGGRCPPVVGEAPVVGLIIAPTPGNRGLSQFPPGPPGNQMAGNTNHPDFWARFK